MLTVADRREGVKFAKILLTSYRAVFFDKLSDVIVYLVKSMESYVTLDKHYHTPIGIVDREFKTIR